MKIACCQFDIAWEDKAANHTRVADMLRAAALPPGSLVLLPEMFATGFSMNVAAIEDTRSRATQSFLSSLAAELKINILAGIVGISPEVMDDALRPPPLVLRGRVGVGAERKVARTSQKGPHLDPPPEYQGRREEADTVTADTRVAPAGASGWGCNDALVFDVNGAEIARYQKLHPFSFSGENKHYLPGRRVVTFDLQGLSICPLICYDLRFPEPFRIAVQRGANCFAIIANWPKQREHHWVTLLQARAIENQAYVAAVNRTGSDPNADYGGRSLIIDPRGNILADAGDSQSIIQADINSDVVAAYREEFPVLCDRKRDYGE